MVGSEETVSDGKDIDGDDTGADADDNDSDGVDSGSDGDDTGADGDDTGADWSPVFSSNFFRFAAKKKFVVQPKKSFLQIS